MEFGERIRILRKRKGLTQAEVASQIGVSRRSYVSYEQQGKQPRNRETYVKLADVLGCDVNDLLAEDDVVADDDSLARLAAYGSAGGKLLGFAALSALGGLSPLGMLPTAAITGAASAAAALTSSKLNKQATSAIAEATPISSAKETLQELVKEHKSFAATARGLIYAALAERGIRFAPSPSAEPYTGIGPEEAISLETDQIDSWWLVFEADGQAPKENEEASAQDLRASMLMSGFFEYAPDLRRKASIVVEDAELFDALLRKRGKNSYRGNLSAILVDRDDVSLTSEAYLATYDEGADITEMLRVADEPLSR